MVFCPLSLQPPLEMMVPLLLLLLPPSIVLIFVPCKLGHAQQ
jgi:hypothetical protein